MRLSDSSFDVCRKSKQAVSVHLSLQIDGEDRFYRLLLLPPPRPTDSAPQKADESLADKLLALLPQVHSQ